MRSSAFSSDALPASSATTSANSRAACWASAAAAERSSLLASSNFATPDWKYLGLAPGGGDASGAA